MTKTSLPTAIQRLLGTDPSSTLLAFPEPLNCLARSEGPASGAARMQWLITARDPVSLGAAAPARAHAETLSRSPACSAMSFTLVGAVPAALCRELPTLTALPQSVARETLTRGDTARDRKWIRAEKMVLPSTKYWLSTRSALAQMDSPGKKDTSAVFS